MYAPLFFFISLFMSLHNFSPGMDSFLSASNIAVPFGPTPDKLTRRSQEDTISQFSTNDGKVSRVVVVGFFSSNSWKSSRGTFQSLGAVSHTEQSMFSEILPEGTLFWANSVRKYTLYDCCKNKYLHQSITPYPVNKYIQYVLVLTSKLLYWWDQNMRPNSDIFLKKFSLHFGAVAENHTASSHFFCWETF